MSQIQALPKDILANITPHLVSDETIKQALLQDNKKPNIIWLISTNQAIILHGQQEVNTKPVILIFALDEIKEIDYLQKADDIQVNIVSGVSASKAVFHFEIAAKAEVEKFFLEFGDLITYRYVNEKGKIEVVQRALPIGDKERHKFGRGKKIEVKAQQEQAAVKAQTPKPAATEEAKVPAPSKPATENKNIEQKLLENIHKKTTETKSTSDKKPTVTAEASKQTVNQPKPAEKEQKAAEVSHKKIESEAKPVSSNKPVTTDSKAKAENKPEETKTTKPVAKKEIDYGNPVFFISVTVIATAVGFLCMSFFKSISKIVTFFKRH